MRNFSTKPEYKSTYSQKEQTTQQQTKQTHQTQQQQKLSKIRWNKVLISLLKKTKITGFQSKKYSCECNCYWYNFSILFLGLGKRYETF